MPATSQNRTFFATFFAVFRAHSIQKAPFSTSQSSSVTASLPITTSPPQASSPRTIATKQDSYHAVQAAAAQQFSSRHQPSSSRTGNSKSPLPYSPPRSPSPPASSFQRSRTPSQTRVPQARRGSDSSSDAGLREALTRQNWYIGGRTAQGEERFYKLGMVRRYSSKDRLSMDRLSL